MAGNSRPQTGKTPAIFWLVDPSESGLILKHQAHPAGGKFVENFGQFSDSIVNFFEASITSSLALFGCLLRGMTFRQP